MVKTDLAIIVVDNEPLVRLGISMMLREGGLRCSAADSEQSAMALIASGMVPDLLIADQNMPGKSGIELGLELKSQFPAMEILIVSGDERVADDMPEGWHILAKPFTAGELRDKISRIYAMDIAAT
jgi:CheY-like chemotaxis protein